MGSNVAYPEKWNVWLKENSSKMSRSELTRNFNQTFNQNKSVNAIKTYCNLRKWYSPSNGRFKKGNISWQTGVKGDEFRSHYTEESLYRLSHPELTRKLKIGDEYLRRKNDPYIVVSVEPNKNITDRSVPKRRYVWELHNGKIPKDHYVINLDGNHMNNDLNNLACIPIKFRFILAKNKWFVKGERNPELTKAAIKWCELYYALKELEETKNENHI